MEANPGREIERLLLGREAAKTGVTVIHTLISEVLAIATFIGAFWPMARRGGAHARVWLLGWAFILLQNVCLLLSTASGLRHQITLLGTLWAAELSGLCFIRGAEAGGPNRMRGTVLMEMAVPIMFQSALYAFDVHSTVWRTVAALLLLAPAVHLVARRAERSRPLVQLAVGLAVLAVLSDPFHSFSVGGLLNGANTGGTGYALGAMGLFAASSGIPCLLFLTAASLVFQRRNGAGQSGRVTRGAGVAGLGLAGCGLSYGLMFALTQMRVTVDRALLDLPLYLMSYGMILTLLEQHLGRTEQLALADHLTGLPNIRHFEERCGAAFAMAAERRCPLACLVIDVDDFKRVNDTLGHPAGDELLKALAVRLAWHISPRDTLARTGGDEFTALLVGGEDGQHLNFIARAMMAAACVPVTIEGRSIAVTMSIGMAVSAAGRQNLEVLRKAADDAMYQAKRRGGGMLVLAGQGESGQGVAELPPGRAVGRLLRREFWAS